MDAYRASIHFYPGIFQPGCARHFKRSMISVNALTVRDRDGKVLRARSGPWGGSLRVRRSPIECPEYLLDSGAFTRIAQHGEYPEGPEVHAEVVATLASHSPPTAVVAEDLMCEPFITSKTGGSVEGHQRQTIERYLGLLEELEVRQAEHVPVMPVLQGYEPSEYARHVRDYGDLLRPGMWVGVGSVCRRNGRPREIEAVLLAIAAERPDLRLHLFGIKATSLKSALVRNLSYSADSMAWSFRAKKQGGVAHDWREAAAFVREIEEQQAVEGGHQLSLPGF